MDKRSFVACIGSFLSRFFFPPVSLIWVSVFLDLSGDTSLLFGNSVPMGRGGPLTEYVTVPFSLHRILLFPARGYMFLDASVLGVEECKNARRSLY